MIQLEQVASEELVAGGELSERGLGASPPEAPPGETDRLRGLVPILLATLGLAAAVIAWRAGTLSIDAQSASAAGLDATRNLATTEVIDEGVTARTMAAYLDYERSRRRALALSNAGLADQALLNDMEASAHWFLVDPQYLDRAGQLQLDRERAALLAGTASQLDVQPAPHFTAADADYARVQGLVVAGIVALLALPLFTIAQVGRRRLRLFGLAAGGLLFISGLVLTALSW